MTIDEWWPLVNREVRRWVAGKLFSVLSPFSLDEIAKAGGPAPGDPYWARDRQGIERYLPADAVKWISMNGGVGRESAEQDTRAAYFRRSWPRT